MNDQQMREEWKAAGGSIHGPNVETVCMPESEYFKFRKSLVAQGEPVGEVVDPTYVHFYDGKQYPFGTLLYTHPTLAVAVNEQMLEALKSTGLFLHHCWCDVQMNNYSFEKLNEQMRIVDAAIAAAEAAKKGGGDE